tara:strand:+ start:1519 stop:2694 length:1176 start_codon:yes stop_codon:yes gene_type:complete
MPGFLAHGVACGIKINHQKDLALILSEVAASVAAVFTKNQVPSPSVTFSKNVLKRAKTVRAIIVNSGNANAITGDKGYADCRIIVEQTAAALGVNPREILIASTGVIGVALPIKKVLNEIPNLVAGLTANGWKSASEAILTTDLVSKTAQTSTVLNGKKITVGGIAKGSGMIHPNMATMLGFITTDASISSKVLKSALLEAIDPTFNAITVDGESSTNDCVMALANGRAENASLRRGSVDYKKFVMALTEVCRVLSWKIVKDGEGATKFITVRVFDAKTKTAARKVAVQVAKSTLVKTAMFGQDPNWGRIIAAMGNANVALQQEKIEIRLDNVVLVKKGQPVAVSKKKLLVIMKKKDIRIDLFLNQGNHQAEVYTCDLSYDYVRINAEYTT